MSILPDVAIELYSSIMPSLLQSDTLLATLTHVTKLSVHGLLCGFYSAESKIAQLAAKIYSVPQISGTSVSYSLSSKVDYPYFARMGPPDTIQIDGIVKLYQQMNWTRGIVIYTDEDYGSGYSRLVNAAQNANITLLPISIPGTLPNVSAITPYIDLIVSTAKKTGYRTFVFYTIISPSVQLVRAGMNESGLFGPNYVYVLTAPSVNNYVFGNASYALNEGAIGFAFGAPRGPAYDSVYNTWAQSTNNPWPAPARDDIPRFSWYDLDALYSFVYAFDSLLKSGMAYSDVKGAAYLKQISSQRFTGTTGEVAFDGTADRLGSYDIYTMRTQGVTQVGTYDGLTKEISLTGQFVFHSGRVTIPKDGPYTCSLCDHGTCVEDVGCVCHKGYSGQYCSNSTSNPTWTIGLAVGVVVVLVIGAASGFYYYRKKRTQLVKQVAEKQRSNIKASDIIFGARIGRGASGEVFKAKYRGTDVAVKKIVASNVDSKVIQDFEMEVAIMCGLRHPNIILFMGSCFDQTTKEMLLVMEFMTKGSLHDVLHNPKIELTYDMKLHLAVQAAHGMNFLHQSSPPIIHSDLKSHNILLDDKWNSKISDFGITKFKTDKKAAAAQKGINSGSVSGFGTIFWSAPETLSNSEHSEKSDVYAFGVILWEIFHRQDPYLGRDPVSVAIDVIVNNLRPTIDINVPHDMKALIEACWHKEPDMRPSFQDIMTSLRSLSTHNPVAGFSAAPTGHLYLVNTCVVGALSLWERLPIPMLKAMKLHNSMIREKLNLYRGYEAQYDASTHSFLLAFPRVDDALNFCVETLVDLTTLPWPEELLRTPGCASVRNNVGTVLWKGLHTRMSVISGVPNCELDSTTSRMAYMGPLVEKSRKILCTMQKGSIIVADPVCAAIAKTGLKLAKPVTFQSCANLTVSGEQAGERVNFQKLIIAGYENSIEPAIESNNHPHHVLLDVEDTLGDKDYDNSPRSLEATWIAKEAELDIKEQVGSKGTTGDFRRAIWNRKSGPKEVVVKHLVNQKLHEDDLLKLISDAAYMSQMNHPNVLKFFGVCLDEGAVSLITEYMPNGNLKDRLANTGAPLPLRMRIQMAIDIANGMKFLDSCQDNEALRKHDSLKSNNIMIGKDLEVKITDYGQTSIKDLARTMTSIGSIAWTAPEILAGEENTTAKIAVYSFGIILWELYTRQVPYENEHPIRVVTKILTGYRPPIPSDCPPKLQQLIVDCLKNEPQQRPSWDSIKNNLTTILSQM